MHTKKYLQNIELCKKSMLNFNTIYFESAIIANKLYLREFQ